MSSSKQKQHFATRKDGIYRILCVPLIPDLAAIVWEYVFELNFYFLIQFPNAFVMGFDEEFNLTLAFGRNGKGEGEFRLPSAITCDTQSESLLICDSNDQRVQILDLQGNFVRFLGVGLLACPLNILTNGSLVAIEDFSQIVLFSWAVGGWHKEQIVWSGDYADETFFDREEEEKLVHVISAPLKKSLRFVVDHSKKLFVDRGEDIDPTAWHPLPILTAEGCGRGGGDYAGSEPCRLVGSWARDSISMEVEAPENFKELATGFDYCRY